MPTRLPDRLRNRPFTTAEALAAGVGRGVLAGPTVCRVFAGVYVAATVELNLRLRVEAALLILPASTVATGLTALWCWGVSIAREPHPVTFVTLHPHLIRRPGLVVHRVGRLPPVRGPYVSPEHAFVSAARHLDLIDLVSAGDWLVRLRRCTPESLIAYAAGSREPGVAMARRASHLVRRRVDSPQETRLRLCIVFAGLPEPRCNVTLGTDDRPIGRVDLLLEEFTLILEYEGDQHRIDRNQWNVDIGRVEEFGYEGYYVLRVTSAHLRSPRTLIQRIHRALVGRGYSGPPPAFTPEWCALFERFVR